MISVKEELESWGTAHGRRPRIVLYALKEMKSEVLAIAQSAQLLWVCVEQGKAPEGYPSLTMAELSGLSHAAYDFVILAAEGEGRAVIGKQRLEMAGIDYRKILWLQTGRYCQKNIAILVSRRRDIPSVAVPNPLYMPVRCGAYYDTPGGHIFRGDNTGDNISRYQPYFSEFTVQYWGWKNLKADYYGLCHYRRYLSFADEIFPVNERTFVKEQLLDTGAMEKYGLLDCGRMREVIEGNDAVLNVPGKVERIPIQGEYYQTVWELWAAHAGLFIREDSLTALMEAIEKQEPEYLVSAREYLHGSLHRGYNCYVLRRELFAELCRLQEHILRGLFTRFLCDGTLRHYPRVCGYMGEILYGIYCHKLVREGRWRIEERQMVEFDDTLLKEYDRGGSAL